MNIKNILILSCLLLGNFTVISEPLLSIGQTTAVIEDVAFHKLGTYRGFTDDGIEYQKSYFYPKYKLTAKWLESRAICNSYNLELTTIETLSEVQAIMNLVNRDNLFTIHAYVDAITLTLKSTTDWYWTKSGKKLSFDLPWRPGEPNNWNNYPEVCLIFDKNGFCDGSCYSTAYSFLCQRIDFILPKKNI